MCMKNIVIPDENFVAPECSYKIAFRVSEQSPETKELYCTPFQSAYFSEKLVAVGKPSIYNHSFGNSSPTLYGGAIHCFKDIKYALEKWCFNLLTSTTMVVLIVKGKNCVAYNDTEIAFDEIEVIQQISNKDAKKLARDYYSIQEKLATNK